MSKKILYLSYFFEPDLGAGSFRNSALAKKLSSMLGEGDEIELITATPNRYAQLQSQVPEKEIIDKLHVFRIKVERSSNTFIHQIKGFIKYWNGVHTIVKNKKYDLVFASSSKLFTAYLGYRIAKAQSTKLYLDIRDLFAENLKELFPKFKIGQFFSYFLKIFFEKPCIQYADHLNLNSGGFADEFKYKKRGSLSYYPNGIDDYFIGHTQDSKLPTHPIVITYAGNIGDGQGLHKIVPMLAGKLGNDYLFQIIGDGSALNKLKKIIQEHGLHNVRLIAPVRRDKLLYYYTHSHYLFLHLNNFKSFEKVIPSKIFEYAALDIPILAGVAGYPAHFIETEVNSNCLVFEPCNVVEAYRKLQKNHYTRSDRKTFVDKYRRETIVSNMAQNIMDVL